MNAQSEKKSAVSGRARAGRPRLGTEQGRGQILEKAITAFARLGYEGVSLRHLASEAGVNIALANYHFGSKHALWEAALNFLLDRAAPYIAQLQAIASSATPRTTQIIQFWSVFIDLNQELPEYGLFILQDEIRESPRQAIVQTRLIEPLHAISVGLLRQAMADGAIPEQNASLLFLIHATAISNLFAASESLTTSLAGKGWSRQQQRADMLRVIVSAIMGRLDSEQERELNAVIASSRSKRTKTSK